MTMTPEEIDLTERRFQRVAKLGWKLVGWGCTRTWNPNLPPLLDGYVFQKDDVKEFSLARLEYLLELPPLK